MPSAQLTWTDNATNEEGFRVQRRIPAENVTWVTVATVGPNADTYTDPDLMTDKVYEYRVSAFRGAVMVASNVASLDTTLHLTGQADNLVATLIS